MNKVCIKNEGCITVQMRCKLAISTSFLSGSATPSLLRCVLVSISSFPEVVDEPGLVERLADVSVEVLVQLLRDGLGVHQPHGAQVVRLGPVQVDVGANEAAVLLDDVADPAIKVLLGGAICQRP